MRKDFFKDLLITLKNYAHAQRIFGNHVGAVHIDHQTKTIERIIESDEVLVINMAQLLGILENMPVAKDWWQRKRDEEYVVMLAKAPVTINISQVQAVQAQPIEADRIAFYVSPKDRYIWKCKTTLIIQ